MIVFNDNHDVYKINKNNKSKAIIKSNVKQTTRKKLKIITKSNKEFLQTLGFKI